MKLEGLQSFIRRNAVTIGLTVITIAFMLILWIQATALNRLQTQEQDSQRILSSIQTITGQLKDNSKQRTAQINELQSHIDCIVSLFQRPNRAQLTINDLTDCKLILTPASSSSANNGTVTAPNPVTPPKSSNNGGLPAQNTANEGAGTTPQTPSTPSNGSTLDRVPVLGRVFQAIGL